MEIAIVLIVFAVLWNLQRARNGYRNVCAVSERARVNDELMQKFGEQRELVKRLQTTFQSTNQDDDARALWSLVEHWKQQAVKRLGEFDCAGALAHMTHAANQAQRLIDDRKSATPSISLVHVRAFLERQRLGVSLKTAPELF